MKQEKKGFTLIELLGVIVLIAIMAVLAFVVIDKTLKNRKEQMLQVQFENIELAAKNWAVDHAYSLPNEGKEMYINLLTLKLGGYVEQEILNPITKEPFSNCTIITVKHDGNMDKYIYTVDIESINMEGQSCNPKIDINADPFISIDVSPNSLSEGEEAIFNLTYNFPNLDTTKIEFDVTGSEWTIPSKIENGTEVYNYKINAYEMQIKFIAGNAKWQHVKLIVKEGSITNGDKKSGYVESNRIYVDNVPPDLTSPDVSGYSTRTSCVGDNCSQFVITGSEIPPSNQKYCMDYVNHSSMVTFTEYKERGYDAYQHIDLIVEDASRIKYRAYIKGYINEYGSLTYNPDYRVYIDMNQVPDKTIFYDTKSSMLYQYGDTSYKEIKEIEINNYDGWVYVDKGNINYKTIINGDYYFEICDVNDNCMTTEDYGAINLSYNDCIRPNAHLSEQGIFTYVDGDENKYNSKSGVRSAYLYVSQQSGLSYLRRPDHTDSYKIDYIGLSQLQGDYNSVYNTIKSKTYYVGENYFYIFIEDNARNLNVVQFNKNPFIMGSDGKVIASNSVNNNNTNIGYYCDRICQMEKNSLSWWTCPTDACKNDLHEKNLTLCSGITNCEYNPNDGKYYVGDEPLYNISTTNSGSSSGSGSGSSGGTTATPTEPPTDDNYTPPSSGSGSGSSSGGNIVPTY